MSINVSFNTSSVNSRQKTNSLSASNASKQKLGFSAISVKALKNLSKNNEDLGLLHSHFDEDKKFNALLISISKFELLFNHEGKKLSSYHANLNTAFKKLAELLDYGREIKTREGKVYMTVPPKK